MEKGGFMKAVDRLINYVKIETTSNPETNTSPTSENQFDLARVLKEELIELGVEKVILTDTCYVYAFIPSNVNIPTDKIGLIAHMDTAPDFSGKNVNPRIVEKYDGSDILLNNQRVLSKQRFTQLEELIGHDLLVTDGTTLLGADDKAGISVIMTLVEYIMSHPEFKHGDIRIAFTPDEEVGKGADHFDVKLFDADYAFTFDGGHGDDLSYETFNAASVDIEIEGLSVHPGSAKGRMINASLIGCEFISMLPVFDRPEFTEGKEGFNHLTDFNGDVSYCKLQYIVRNHDMNVFNRQLALFEKIKTFINEKYNQELVKISTNIQYNNMYEVLKDHMHIVNKMQDAMLAVGITPKIEAIRGGTDGSRLTFMNLPCPNVGCGGGNFHGPYEYCSITDLNRAVEVAKHLVSVKGE